MWVLVTFGPPGVTFRHTGRRASAPYDPRVRQTRRERRAASRRSGAPASGAGGIRRFRWALVAVPVLVVGLAFAIGAVRAPEASGHVVAGHTTHEFGTIRMQDGLLSAAFPLTVEAGEVDAVDLTTS